MCDQHGSGKSETGVDMNVSVVIPCFNHSRFLRQAVSSVTAQTYKDWELIIVDDGSTDGSLETAVTLSDEYADIDMTILRTRNKGLSHARNTGIAVSRAKYLLPLDADDWIEPEMLERTVDALEARPAAVAATVTVRSYPDNRVWDHMPPYTLATERVKNVLPYCSLFRRDAWRQVGGYCEQLPAFEDWEFWIAIGKLGPIRQIDAPLFRYRVSGDGLLARSLERNLELRAMIVQRHPDVYGADAVQFAERISAGEKFGTMELHRSPHPIFATGLRISHR
jgi:glycosyltransferase involved in cell wall biosynthesis